MAVELGNKNYPQKKQVHEGCSKEFAASLTLFLISKPKLRMQRICLDTSRGSRCRKGMRSLIHFSVAPSAERGIVAFVGLARRVRAAVAIISRLLESHCVVGRLIVGASCPIREYPAASPSAAAVILFLSRRDFAARDLYTDTTTTGTSQKRYKCYAKRVECDGRQVTLTTLY